MRETTMAAVAVSVVAAQVRKDFVVAKQGGVTVETDRGIFFSVRNLESTLTSTAPKTDMHDDDVDEGDTFVWLWCVN